LPAGFRFEATGGDADFSPVDPEARAFAVAGAVSAVAAAGREERVEGRLAMDAPPAGGIGRAHPHPCGPVNPDQ
jgi:hypothetical protein